MAKAIGSGGKKKSGGSGFLILLVALMIVGGGVFTFMRFQSNKAPGGEDPAGEAGTEVVQNTVSVAVVQSSVKTGDLITEENVAYEDVPANSVIPDNTVRGGGLDFSKELEFALDLEPNTVLTDSMVWDPTLDESIDNTSREVVVNYLTVTNKLQIGDYIDIRLRKASTKDSLAYEDQVVLAKKRVVDVSGSKITLNLTEEEQVILGVAAVDVTYTNSNPKLFNNLKASLYVNLYVRPDQEAAIADYSNPEIQKQIQSNPNLVQAAQDQLAGNPNGLVNGVPTDGQQVPVDQNTGVQQPTTTTPDNNGATGTTTAPSGAATSNGLGTADQGNSAFVNP